MQLFNIRIASCIELLDIMNTPRGDWSLGFKLSSLSYLIFLDTKEHVLETCIKKTQTAIPTKTGRPNLNICQNSTLPCNSLPYRD